MDNEIKIFHISEIEVNRRKKAFTSLIISFFIFSLLFSIDLIVENVTISIISILFFALMLFLFRIMTLNYLNNFLKMKLVIEKNNLIKIWNKNQAKCFFNEIKYIKIKKTIKGCNREISVFTKTNADMIINGLDDFSSFENELLNKIENKKIKIIKEPIDYDHFLFYPILGLLLSFIFIYAVKIFSNFDYQNIKIFYHSVLLYNFSMCIYFFITRPLSKTSEKKKVNPDLIFILLIICINVFFIFIYFGNKECLTLKKLRTIAAIRSDPHSLRSLRCSGFATFFLRLPSAYLA